MIGSNVSLRPRAIEEFGRSWHILCAAMLGMLFCCLPGSATGVFIGPWSDAFGWSLSEIGGCAVCLGLGAAFSGPLMGRWMDRFGGRRVVLLYIPILSCSVAATSLIGNDVWSLYLVMLVRGFVATGLAAYTRAVSVSFNSGRGTALGLICLGVGLSTAIGPRLAQWLVDDYGWLIGNQCLAAIVLLAWPLAYFWIHEPRIAVTWPKTESAETDGYTRQQALKTAVFWLLGSSFLLWGLTAGGTLFLMPFLSSHGMSRADAASCMSMLGIVTVIGLPVFGAVIDRLHAPFVAATALLVSASAFILLGVSGSQYAAFAVPLIGLAGSAWMSCLDYSSARYFGLRAFSEISGLIDRMACIGAMIGPLIFSLLLDVSGGKYTVPYLTVGILGAGSAICMAMAGRHPFFSDFPIAITAPAAMNNREDTALYAVGSFPVQSASAEFVAPQIERGHRTSHARNPDDVRRRPARTKIHET